MCLKKLPEVCSVEACSVEACSVEACSVDDTDFVDWLWWLCFANLRPSSNFQRIKTSLDWAATILETLVYSPGRQQRKGGCPGRQTIV